MQYPRLISSKIALWLPLCLLPCSCAAHGTETPKLEILQDVENLSILAGSAIVTLIVSSAARELLQWVTRRCSRHLHLLQTGFENFAFNLVILALILANIGVALKILNRQFFSLIDPKLIDQLEGRLERHMNDNPWGWTVACVLVSYGAAEVAKRFRSQTKPEVEPQETVEEQEIIPEDKTTAHGEFSPSANPATLSPTLSAHPIHSPVHERPPSHILHPPGWSIGNNAPPPPSFLGQTPPAVSEYDPLGENAHTGGAYDPMLETNAVYPPPLPEHVISSEVHGLYGGARRERTDLYGPEGVLPPPLPTTNY